MGIRYSGCYRDSTSVQQQSASFRRSFPNSLKTSSTATSPVPDTDSKCESSMDCGLSFAISPTLVHINTQSNPTSDECGISVPFSTTESSPIIFVSNNERNQSDTNKEDAECSIERSASSFSHRRLPDLPMQSSESTSSSKKISLQPPPSSTEINEAFQSLLEQLFAVIPTGSVSTVVVLLSSFARTLQCQQIPAFHLCKLLREVRWYRYRDLPPSPDKTRRLSTRLTSKMKEGSNKEFTLADTSGPTSPETSSLWKMVATDMTMLHIAAVYGHHDMIAFFVSLLTLHQLEISAWLNLQDPVFGMTPLHMMVLAHQTESVLSLVHLLEVYDMRESAYVKRNESALFEICSVKTTTGKTLLHLLFQECEVAVWHSVLLSLSQVTRGSESRRITSAQWLQLWSSQEYNDENSILHILALRLSPLGMQLLLQHWQQMLDEFDGAILESDIMNILQVIRSICFD